MFSGGFLLIKLQSNFKENQNFNLLKINALQLFYVKNSIFVYIITIKNMKIHKEYEESGESGEPVEKIIFIYYK